MPRHLVPIGITAVGFIALLTVSVTALDGHPETTQEVTETSRPETPAERSILPRDPYKASPAPTHSSMPVKGIKGGAAPSSPTAEPSASATTSPKVTPTQQPQQKHQDKPEKPKQEKPKKPQRSIIREGLDVIVPGLKEAPDWVLPIVHRAEENAAPGTVVHAYMTKHGNLVIEGKVKVEKDHGFGWFTMASFQAEEEEIVDVRAVVEDPTEATEDNPTSVKVTVTDPETEQETTSSAEVTNPDEAADVTAQAVTETVESAGVGSLDLPLPTA